MWWSAVIFFCFIHWLLTAPTEHCGWTLATHFWDLVCQWQPPPPYAEQNMLPLCISRCSFKKPGDEVSQAFFFFISLPWQTQDRAQTSSATWCRSTVMMCLTPVGPTRRSAASLISRGYREAALTVPGKCPQRLWWRPMWQRGEACGVELAVTGWQRLL